MEFGKRLVAGSMLGLRVDGRKKTLERLIRCAARKLGRTQEHKGICIAGIFRQYGFQENCCLIFLVRLQKRSNPRVYRLSGGRIGVCKRFGTPANRLIVICCVRSVPFQESGQLRRRCYRFAGSTRQSLARRSSSAAANLTCASVDKDLDVVRRRLFNPARMVLSASYASSTLQEANVFKADLSHRKSDAFVASANCLSASSISPLRS
jgi:hypothetical protein